MCQKAMPGVFEVREMLWKDNQFFAEVPLPKAGDGPLIVVHPAAGGNYLASWNIMTEHGQPFVLICDDVHPHYPDMWPYHSDDLGSEYFARIADPVGIGAAYRNPDLGFHNLLVHREMDGKEGYLNIPGIDILYLDWLTPFTEDDNRKSFMDCIALMASRVKDGGIIILDKKHQKACPQWFDFPDGGEFDVSDGISLQHIGMGDWPILSLRMPNGGGIAAEVFRVSNSNQLGCADDFLATLMVERRMDVASLEMMMRRIPQRWSSHPDRDYWIERYLDHLDIPSIPELDYPYPLMGPWDADRYKDWVQSLIDEPHHLRPAERNAREFIFGGIKTTIIHGDIIDHVDWLYLKDASLILRNKQLRACLTRCLPLKFKAVKLQPKWGFQPITSLKWSGKDASVELTQRLLNLALSPVVATIVHGDASLAQLEAELQAFDGPVEELIIFHLDEDDYQEGLDD